MGNPHTDREIDALWREIRRAQRRVQAAEVQVAAATEPAPGPPAPDDFSDTQVLIEGGDCLWPTHCYMLPVWNFTEGDLTSQFTHPAQWATWAAYREDLYRTIVLDLHWLYDFHNPFAGSQKWHEETGSANPYQAIWQETVGDDSYEVREYLTAHRDSYVHFYAVAGASLIYASCWRMRHWTAHVNGVFDGTLNWHQVYRVQAESEEPLACADIPIAINAGGLPYPIADRIFLTSSVSWVPNVSMSRVAADIYIPETAIGTAA
jgi:hypothetical protein